MVQVNIRNFAADASDLANTINFDGVEIVGEPLFTPMQLSATFTDGRGFAAMGNFQPLFDAQGGDLDALLTAIAGIRIDSLSVTINGTPWIEMAQIDLTGIEIFQFLDASDLDESTDPNDVGNQEFDAAAAFLFAGNDTIVADLGNDTLRGYGGNDIVLGMNGNDSVDGDAGDDEINGNLGDDIVAGGEGKDFARGGQGNDVVFGGPGDDWHVNGNIGNDEIYGNLGSDTVFGGQGNDFVVGDNFAYGEGGNDSLIGNLGNDTLVGDPGNDTLQGGDGVDQFDIYTGDGNDLILDFDPATEVIALEPNINGIGFTASSSFSVLQARISASGPNSVIDLGAGNSVTVVGMLPNQFVANDFAFIF